MLTPRLETPTQALDLAFRRQKPTRAQLDDFQQAQAHLLQAINPKESEEHLKKLLVDFLAHPSVLGTAYYLNVSKRRDLVIRTGPKEAAPVGTIVEVKRAANSAEMVTPHDLNRKAFHELLLYYLEDRRDGHADNLRRLVITNGYEWFVFDALDFDRLFWRNTALKNDFLNWATGKKAGKTTEYFYTSIAQPSLASLGVELAFTYLDLRLPTTSERDLLTRAKVFQAPHLLKAPFAQDANTLNRAFYEELLYLIGLEEVPDKGRKLIKRVAPAEREQAGSLLRNTIDVLESEDRLTNLPPAERNAYGPTHEAQLFGVALELCLTWVNRLLFLKLLEGQLRRYHAGNPTALTEPFRFLTPALIPDFDTLNDLFFKVLNKPADQRTAAIRQRYAHLPYLNSSLYETSELERRTLPVRELADDLTLPLHRKSVLPAQKVPPPTLAYLLRFLDAYDFASEGDEQVQETHKPLISAAVLGLIFEKLNGYQDGSFYTPGFITMYIARHTLRRAVVQHFNRRYGYQAADVPALAEALEAKNRVPDSAYFNTLTVLDPAVGSGHFLVSALNELLAIKAELGLLLDDTGKRLRYRLTVARDELVVVHEDDDPHDPAALFQYRARLDAATGQRFVAPAHTALQRALFHDKRHLIEHALFGVDLNPNSVRICRLRLWIELLKHAYYLPDTGFAQLETLPNLDLNIKAGNSLLARFDLTADLSDVFRQSKFTLATYRDAVHAYFNTRDRAAKQELQKFLGQIKEQFTQALHKRDPLREKLRRAVGERTVLETQGQLLPETPKQRETRDFEIRRLTLLVEQYEKEVERYEQGQLYRHAFEWRFEFPEVLDEKGQFRGFDVVIGNPPYIRQEELAHAFKKYLKAEFVTGTGTADLYVYFYELGLNLLAAGGELSFITNNKWLRSGYGAGLRGHLLQSKFNLVELIDFDDLPVFPEAVTYPNILSVQSAPSQPLLRLAELDKLEPEKFEESISNSVIELSSTHFNADSWSFALPERRAAFDKIKASGVVVSDYIEGKIYNGIKTGFNEAFVFGQEVKDKLTTADSESEKYIRPFLEGRDVKRYQQPRTSTYILYLTWDVEFEALPEPIKEHLISYEAQLKNRSEVKQGNYPWFVLERPRAEIKSVFSNKKIIITTFSKDAPYTLDCDGYFSNDKTTIIPSDDLFILGVLNSRIVDSYFKTLASTKANGYFEYKPIYLNQLPIPHATPEQQAEIAALVEQVLAVWSQRIVG